MLEEKDSGWISIYRKIQDCWIWNVKTPFDERSAWIDLLMLANHKDIKMVFNGELITVKRGQRITSIRTLADRWKWSRDKTHRYLKLLESDKMIERNSDNHRTLLTIVNYEFYQRVPDTDMTQDGRKQDTDQPHTRLHSDTNNNDNNDKTMNNNDNNTSSSESSDKPIPSELKPEVFISWLTNTGEVYEVTVDYIQELKELYPAVDVEQQLRNMKGWINSNPTKRKTKSGMKRFINTWLSKDQDRGGSKSKKPNGAKTDFSKLEDWT